MKLDRIQIRTELFKKVSSLMDFPLKSVKIAPIRQNRPKAIKAEIKVRKAVRNFFAHNKKLIIDVILSNFNAKKLTKSGEIDIDRKIKAILDNIDFDGYESFIDIVSAELRLLYLDAAEHAIVDQVKATFSIDAFEQVSEWALAYARDQAAEMVGMKWVDEELIPNPSSEWQITDATRDFLRADVATAMEEGQSNDVLAAKLAENYAFSDERAMTIARTETAKADTQGAIAGYKVSGAVDQKEWLAAHDCCDICQEMGGEIVGLDETFSGDAGGPPLHPNCRCAILPVIKSETENEEQNAV